MDALNRYDMGADPELALPYRKPLKSSMETLIDLLTKLREEDKITAHQAWTMLYILPFLETVVMMDELDFDLDEVVRAMKAVLKYAPPLIKRNREKHGTVTREEVEALFKSLSITEDIINKMKEA